MDFFCKLLPPRAGFSQTMTEAEGQLMQAHAGYWTEWIAKGHVLVYGFVADPKEGFGMGVVNFSSEAEVRAFTDADPAIRAGVGFHYEIHLMPLGATRG